MAAERHVLLGVTGSVAAVKAPELCEALLSHGVSVDVVLTESAVKLLQARSLVCFGGNSAGRGLTRFAVPRRPRTEAASRGKSCLPSPQNMPSAL